MKSYKVVIVDDEPQAIAGLNHLLAKFEQLEVVGRYTDARNALHAIVINKPDILFADIEMPGMDGLELVDHLKNEGCMHLVVYITGHELFAGLGRGNFSYLGF